MVGGTEARRQLVLTGNDMEIVAMFQFFSKGAVEKDFKARSVNRDRETDQTRASSVLRAIEQAIEAAKAEQAGLKSRLDDVLARAAVTLGNDVDEYLTRDTEDSRHQDLLGNEIANGERRLSELASTIGHFQFLRTALLTRFSNFNFSNEAGKRHTA
jgi:hypothetical protein